MIVGTTLRLLALASLGYLLLRMTRPHGRESAPYPEVRDVQPGYVQDPSVEADWDDTDELSDASFPASDPPAKY